MCRNLHICQIISSSKTSDITPWKATEAERANYCLNFLPLRQYNEVRREARYCMSVTSGTAVYPERLVQGKDASFRARRAMEVMRRIFAAQRQCRAIIAVQRPPEFRKNYRKHSTPSEAEVVTKKQRTVEGVQILGPDGIINVELDISDIDSSVSRISSEKSSKKSAQRRRRECEGTDTTIAPLKRRRTASPKNGCLEDQQGSPSQNANTHARSVLSIAQLSSPQIDAVPPATQSPQSPVLNGIGIDSSQATNTGKRAGKTVGTGAGVADQSHISPRNLKRPRAVTPKIGQSSSNRLSVNSLLSPSLVQDVGATAQSSPASLLQSVHGPLAGSTSHSNFHPKLTQTASAPYQNLLPGAANMPPGSKTPDLLTHGSNQFLRSSPPLPRNPGLPSTPNPLTPLFRNPATKHGTPMNYPIPSGDMRTPQASGMNSHLQTSPFPYQGGNIYDTTNTPVNAGRDPNGERAQIGSSAHIQVPGLQPQMKREMTGQMPSVGVRRAHAPAHAPAVFHPSVSPMPLIGNH